MRKKAVGNFYILCFHVCASEKCTARFDCLANFNLQTNENEKCMCAGQGPEVVGWILLLFERIFFLFLFIVEMVLIETALQQSFPVVFILRYVDDGNTFVWNTKVFIILCSGLIETLNASGVNVMWHELIRIVYMRKIHYFRHSI